MSVSPFNGPPEPQGNKGRQAKELSGKIKRKNKKQTKKGLVIYKGSIWVAP